jgi:hypothetical protein
VIRRYSSWERWKHLAISNEFLVWSDRNILFVPLIWEQRLTSANYLQFPMKELPLLMDVLLETRLRIFFQHDGACPHFGHQVTAYLNQR